MSDRNIIKDMAIATAWALTFSMLVAAVFSFGEKLGELKCRAERVIEVRAND